MYSFKTHDVNDALERGLSHLLNSGVEEDSRNGKVLAAPEPVCIEFIDPRRRVLYSATRDANPWFHLMESLWMLAGDNDIEFPTYFNSTYGRYSDDGRTMWDAYGWRWRRFFGWDQLDAIVNELAAHPESRRCVLTMWNPMDVPEHWDNDEAPYSSYDNDFDVAIHGGRAVPCNTHAYLDLRSGKLNITVCNRSNDLLFGMLGANVVHMSLLQEYIAMRVGTPIGVYRQFTNNCHAYLDVFSREKMTQIAYECDTMGALPDPGPALEPGFDEDLATFMPWARNVIRGSALLPPDSVKTKFMASVIIPMFAAWTCRKRGRLDELELHLAHISALDWQRACREWIERRLAK